MALKTCWLKNTKHMVVKDVIEEPKPLKEMLVAEPRDVACQSPKRPKPPKRKFGRDALTVEG